LLAHFKPPASLCEPGRWCKRKNPCFTPS
jgi:hypothetical protein